MSRVCDKVSNAAAIPLSSSSVSGGIGISAQARTCRSFLPLLTKTAYDNDLLMIYANNDTRICQLLPPLVMEMEKVDWIMNRLEKALTAARRLKPLASIKYQVERIVKRFS